MVPVIVIRSVVHIHVNTRHLDTLEITKQARNISSFSLQIEVFQMEFIYEAYQNCDSLLLG